MKEIFKYFLIFCIIIISFNLFLYFTSLFPSNLIENNVKESAEILKEAGNDEMLSQIFPVKNNNYTDAIMINMAYSIDSENPIYSYMNARKNYKKGITKLELKDINGELESIKPNALNEFTEEYNPTRRIV